MLTFEEIYREFLNDCMTPATSNSPGVLLYDEKGNIRKMTRREAYHAACSVYRKQCRELSMTSSEMDDKSDSYLVDMCTDKIMDEYMHPGRYSPRQDTLTEFNEAFTKILALCGDNIKRIKYIMLTVRKEGLDQYLNETNLKLLSDTIGTDCPESTRELAIMAGCKVREDKGSSNDLYNVQLYMCHKLRENYLKQA